MRPISLLAIQVLLIAGCSQLQTSAPPASVAAHPAGRSLSLIVAELQLHIREDSYRTSQHLDARGENGFARALWRLDRLKARRGLPLDEWANVDVVIEYARARALERLRRYDEAAASYARVGGFGSLFSEQAIEASATMERFARASEQRELVAQPEDQAVIEERIASWRELSAEFRGTAYEPVVLEELESWEMMRVDVLARGREIDEAVRSCRRMIERHRDSKLYARHLIRLGDLYAEAARRQHRLHLTQLSPFDPQRYDGYLASAFSAYELAGEDRQPELRREAETKIEALLAYHDGVRAYVP